MTRTKLEEIYAMPQVAIIAPAGHGKTEMIADIVSYKTGKQLILTHTNAGVSALGKRMIKRKISKDRYAITTIAAFCTRWCNSYYHTADFNRSLSPLGSRAAVAPYYEQLYSGTKNIFETEWAGSILKATYSGIIVDEYQDCIQEQHEIMFAISKFLPIRVLGDPMQGIFSFAGTLVDWTHLEFPIKEIATKPWRWQDSNPGLGEYLVEVRKQLLPSLDGKSCSIHIDSLHGNIEVIPPNKFNGYKLLKELHQYESTVYLTKWPQRQLDFCKKMSGVFQYNEKQDCDELFQYAVKFDKEAGIERVLSAIEFAARCMTGVNTELSSYVRRLKDNSLDFSRIRKHLDFQKMVPTKPEDITLKTVLQILVWFFNSGLFKRYRVELISEMIRSLKYAEESQISIAEAAYHIRQDASLQKQYTGFKFLASRTLLSKGLEFDCVIIDMSDPLSAKEFYVAMTRAMKKIYIISDADTFVF